MATRAQVETIVIDGCEAWIAFVEISETPATDASPRSYLGPLLAGALRAVGISAADPTSPTDSEIGSVASASFSTFIDWAKYYLLEKIIGNFDDYDEQAGIDKQQFHYLLDAILKRWEALGKKLGTTAPSLVAGRIKHSWLAKEYETSGF